MRILLAITVMVTVLLVIGVVYESYRSGQAAYRQTEVEGTETTNSVETEIATL